MAFLIDSSIIIIIQHERQGGTTEAFFEHLSDAPRAGRRLFKVSNIAAVRAAAPSWLQGALVRRPPTGDVAAPRLRSDRWRDEDEDEDAEVAEPSSLYLILLDHQSVAASEDGPDLVCRSENASACA